MVSPTAQAERVLSALAGRTETFPPHRSDDPAVGDNFTPSVLLPAEDAQPSRCAGTPVPEGLLPLSYMSGVETAAILQTVLATLRLVEQVKR